jgi:hypothetical protein
VRAGVKGREATAEGRSPLTPERTAGTDQVLAGFELSTAGRFWVSTEETCNVVRGETRKVPRTQFLYFSARDNADHDLDDFLQQRGLPSLRQVRLDLRLPNIGLVW